MNVIFMSSLQTLHKIVLYLYYDNIVSRMHLEVCWKRFV